MLHTQNGARRESPLTKWVVGLVLAVLTGGAAFLATRDRESVDRDLMRLTADHAHMQAVLAQHQELLAVMAAAREREETDRREMRQDIKELKADLSKVLAEVRRANR